MATESIPPQVQDEINDLRRRVGELERRLATLSTASSLALPTTDFICVAMGQADLIGSIEVQIDTLVGGVCGNGFRTTGYIPILNQAD